MSSCQKNRPPARRLLTLPGSAREPRARHCRALPSLQRISFASLRTRAACAPRLFITALRHPDFFIDQRLFVQHRKLIRALILPSRHVSKLLVVAQRLAVFGLVLLAEVAAAGLFAL